MANEKPIAVVLGASYGVGAAVSQNLSCTHEVHGFYRGLTKPSREAAKRLEREWGVRMHQHDAGKTEAAVQECVRMLDTSLDASTVGVLVHSLSGAAVGRAVNVTEEGVERTFANLAHSFLWWTSELAVRGALNVDTPTRLIALSNPVPDFPLRNTGVIGAAKAALEAYVRILAQEIPTACVVGVRFGAVHTPAMRVVLGSPAAIEANAAVNTALMPYGTMQHEGDIAAFIRGLLAPGMEYLTGGIVDLTGGSVNALMDYAFSHPPVEK
jgi:NAD(P)-dependent dehydrogenase (short-subunit alcohol dehydrogenase family)